MNLLASGKHYLDTTGSYRLQVHRERIYDILCIDFIFAAYLHVQYTIPIQDTLPFACVRIYRSTSRQAWESSYVTDKVIDWKGKGRAETPGQGR